MGIIPSVISTQARNKSLQFLMPGLVPTPPNTQIAAAVKRIARNSIAQTSTCLHKSQHVQKVLFANCDWSQKKASTMAFATCSMLVRCSLSSNFSVQSSDDEIEPALHSVSWTRTWVSWVQSLC